MYSPEIREDLIPRVYHAAKSERVHMTTWVNRAVERELALHAQSQPEPQQRKENEGEEITNQLTNDRRMLQVAETVVKIR